MVNIIVATHGNFAKGILSSLKLICGEQKNVAFFCAYVDENGEENGDSQIADKLIKLLDSYPTDEEVVVLADLLGGSVCNEFIKLMGHRPFHLIAGLNLGMLMEFVFLSEDLTLEKINSIIESSRSSIVYVNQLVEQNNDDLDSF